MGRRSFYFPVKDVVDGDLCEQFPQLPADKVRWCAWSGVSLLRTTVRLRPVHHQARTHLHLLTSPRPLAVPHVHQARGVAEELDRSAGEVLKKLEDMRNRIV